VDVEGAELDVLRGISAADWVKVKAVVVEVHDTADNLNSVRSILLSNGYVECSIMLSSFTFMYICSSVELYCTFIIM
jgi:hypothetical protein